MHSICLLTFRPEINWLRFLNSLKDSYSVSILVDDNSYNTSSLSKEFPSLNFIQVEDSLCIEAGLETINPLSPPVEDYDEWVGMLERREIRPTAWGKALYYFSKKDIDYIWFIEDDVFISSQEALKELDGKYPDVDLLVGHADVFSGDMEWYWWRWVPDFLELPWGLSLNCASRFSGELLKRISQFAFDHREKRGVLFNEYFFHTIAIHNKMTITVAPEMQIVYRKDWTQEDFQKGHLYHPVKNMSDHEIYRIQLKFA
jgi:hypothetical protein